MNRQFAESLATTIATSVAVSVFAGLIIAQLNKRGVPTTSNPHPSPSTGATTVQNLSGVTVYVPANTPVYIRYTS